MYKRPALCLGLIGALAAPLAALAVTAETGSWTKNCQAGATTKNVMPGTFACYTPAAGSATDAASPILTVSNCENFDAFLHDDFDGDAVACTVTWQLQMCPPVTLANDTAKNNACNTLPGVAAMTGDDAKSNLAGIYIRVVGGGAGANIDSCRVVVKCAEPGQP